MADVQVRCVNTTGKTHEHITHLGGDSWKWTVAQVIESIERKTNSFFTLVSGKRWKAARTGVEPVKELVAEREARELRDAILVVAGELSDQARALAAQKRVRIYGGAELATLIPDAGRKSR